jgi:hypothetical protein
MATSRSAPSSEGDSRCAKAGGTLVVTVPIDRHCPAGHEARPSDLHPVHRKFPAPLVLHARDPQGLGRARFCLWLAKGTTEVNYAGASRGVAASTEPLDERRVRRDPA